jgi:presenilin 1
LLNLVIFFFNRALKLKMPNSALEPLSPSHHISDEVKAESEDVVLEQEERGEDLEEDDEDDGNPVYSIHHLSAVIWPVMVTMAFATAAVANIRDPVVDAQLQGGISTYLVYNGGSSSGGSGGGGGGGGSSGGGSTASAGTQFGEAAINALVIVCVICAATFGLVACYYFRCLKLLLAYLMLASTMLLGYSGGFMVYTAIRVYKIVIDLPTFLFIMWNFAITGVVAIYWQQGIPRYITQSYLIAVAVIMCWILSNFPEWTSWALLVMLALYDLCAVLTPCGPLRALILLAQERKDPIPGLLYEANTGDGRGSNDDDKPRDTLVMNGSRAQKGESKSASLVRLNPITSALENQEGLPSPPDSLPISTLAQAPPSANNVRDWVTSSPSSSNTISTLSTRVSSINSTHRNETVIEAKSSDVVVTHHSEQEEVVEESQLNVEKEEEDEEEEDRGIKLGLGDFVFYSVLVSRAGLFDASTMAACFTAVLLGLGGTLVLLGVFKKALPALPISIFLGILAYFSTRFAVTPMITELVIGGTVSN